MTYYLICSSPRSGTNLIRHLISHYQLGVPMEIHPDFIDLTRRPVLNNPASHNVHYLHNFLKGCNFTPAYKDDGTNPVSIWSVIVWSFQFRELLNNLRRVGKVEIEVEDAELLDYLYPGIKYVYLHRQNKITQSISIEAARQSGQWYNIRRENLSPFKDYKYDFGSIAQELIWREDAEILWREVFDEFDIQPIEILHEDFVEDMTGEIIRIAEFIGLSVESATDQRTQSILNHIDAPTKQVHPVKSEWESLFRRDLERIARYHEDQDNGIIQTIRYREPTVGFNKRT